MKYHPLFSFILFALLFWGSLPSKALEAEWSSQSVHFNYRLQARNPWWGCRSAEPIVERVLEMFVAQNIALFCEDNQGRGIPEVRLWLQFDQLSLKRTELSSPIQASWKSLSFSSNQLCGCYTSLTDRLLPFFETRNKQLMSSCSGEDGQIYLQADILSPF